MRMIPADSSRTLLLGLLVAAALPTGRAWARQEATADPQPAAPPVRADGWKPKGLVGGTERPGARPSAAATAEGEAARGVAVPPALPDRAPADDATRQETPGTREKDGSGTRPPRGDESTKRAPPATAGATGKQESAAARTLQVGDGQLSLAAEKAAVDKVTAKTSIAEILAVTLPSRSDTGADWSAGPEPLHRCGEPRWIEPCIPLPPCHPSLPPHPFDLVGVPGEPTEGPIYGGPCCPRTGSRDDGPWPHLHRVHDRFFDAFYRTK